MRRDLWPEIEQTLERTFAGAPRDHWTGLFAGTDACLAPVLAPDEVWRDPHIAARHPDAGPNRVPAVPRLSRTPVQARPLDLSDRTEEVLREIGLTEAEITAAESLPDPMGRSGLDWPPDLR